ncbi:hypothetical protein NB693_21495 [Pantoea ananatis]|nr:hypothetical protein [Pantoea ananatis]
MSVVVVPKNAAGNAGPRVQQLESSSPPPWREEAERWRPCAARA